MLNGILNLSTDDFNQDGTQVNGVGNVQGQEDNTEYPPDAVI
jgi:hypothetical protein